MDGLFSIFDEDLRERGGSDCRWHAGTGVEQMRWKSPDSNCLFGILAGGWVYRATCGLSYLERKCKGAGCSKNESKVACTIWQIDHQQETRHKARLPRLFKGCFSQFPREVNKLFFSFWKWFFHNAFLLVKFSFNAFNRWCFRVRPIAVIIGGMCR